MNAKLYALDAEAGRTSCLVIDPVTNDNPRLYADIACLNIGGRHETLNGMLCGLGRIFHTRKLDNAADDGRLIIRPLR